MAFPEHQIAAPQLAKRRQFSERYFLHVAVARAGVAGRLQRDLHQSGAVDAERCLAAPQIGRVEKFLGDRDEIRLPRLERSEMRQLQMPAVGGNTKTFVEFCD